MDSKQRNEIDINRDKIEGCLNRMQITDDMDEINMQVTNLIYYLSQHAQLNKIRINNKNVTYRYDTDSYDEYIHEMEKWLANPSQIKIEEDE